MDNGTWKLSQLIAELQSVLEAQGDMPLYFYDQCEESMCKPIKIETNKAEAADDYYCRGCNLIDLDMNEEHILTPADNVVVVVCSQF